ECRQRGLNVVEYPLYRFVQVLYTILSLASLPLLLYVQIKYIFGSTFHRNIKIIFLLYYSLALVHSATFSTIQVYAITSSLVSKPCDFFPPTYIYIPLHLLISVSWYGLTLTLMALCCERSVATIRFNKYESNGIALSLFLLTLVLIGVFAAIHYVYSFEDFKVRTWSALAIPPGAVKRYNKFSILNTTFGTICIVTLHLSSRINRKRSSINGSTLTSRFQTRENIITTQFATRIASLQIVFFILYGAGGIIARVFGYQVLLSNRNLYICSRQILNVVPVFTFVLPIYSIHQLRRYRLHRDKNIRSIVTMESRGAAGMRNYDEVISKWWKTDHK
ncbi:hypothetical protein Angca_010039, partial [Angiostrongylus cantonensis]